MKEIKLDLKQIFEKEKQPFFKATYEIKPEELGIPADIGEVEKPVRVEVFIKKNPQGEGYSVSYTIKGDIELTCSRCLESFNKNLDGEHSVVVRNGYNEREHLSESDMEVFPLENDVLNLTELVREQIILDVPYKPLCHPSCGGIKTPEVNDEKNNPFAVLKKLKNQKR